MQKSFPPASQSNKRAAATIVSEWRTNHGRFCRRRALMRLSYNADSFCGIVPLLRFCSVFDALQYGRDLAAVPPITIVCALNFVGIAWATSPRSFLILFVGCGF
jgi:hypothetical protein